MKSMLKKNEDFQNILKKDVLGQKSAFIFILEKLLIRNWYYCSDWGNSNKQVLALAQTVDDAILTNYKLWPIIL